MTVNAQRSLCAVLLLMFGCGRSAAPQELQNARHAYQQAEQGPAAHFAPVQLDTARKALNRANRAFATGQDEVLVRDLAYVAERRVAIAASAAALEQANQSIHAYEQQRSTLNRQMRLATQNELERVKVRLAEAEASRQLERERRLAAEARADTALRSLEAIARVRHEARGLVITLPGSLLFPAGEHTLRPIARRQLTEVALALMAQQGKGSIVVEGHTDAGGAPEANRELSLRRAQRVRDHLIRQGIAPSKIQALGRGEAAPLASNETEDGRAINRRVEIVVRPSPDDGR